MQWIQCQHHKMYTHMLLTTSYRTLSQSAFQELTTIYFFGELLIWFAKLAKKLTASKGWLTSWQSYQVDRCELLLPSVIATQNTLLGRLLKTYKKFW